MAKMTEIKAKEAAIAFMKSRPEIAPWSFSHIKYMPASDITGEPHWTAIFDPEDPEWKGHVCFIVDVDDATGVATSFPTL